MTTEAKPAPATAPTPAKTAAKKGRKSLTLTEKEARKLALKNEPADAKFRRLAVPRLRKALKAIGSLAPLGRGSMYQHDAAQREVIFSKLEKALADCRAAFEPRSGSGKSEEVITL